jgi:hypothetical protein
MLSKFFINEPPLPLLQSLAVAVGTDEALVLQQIHYLLVHSIHRKHRFEHYWIDRSYRQFRHTFPFWSESALERIIKSLEERNILTRASLNKGEPRWYTIDYDVLDILIAKATKTGQDGQTDSTQT